MFQSLELQALETVYQDQKAEPQTSLQQEYYQPRPCLDRRESSKSSPATKAVDIRMWEME